MWYSRLLGGACVAWHLLWYFSTYWSSVWVLCYWDRHGAGLSHLYIILPHKQTIIFHNWLIGYTNTPFILDSVEWDLKVVQQFEHPEASKERMKGTSSVIYWGTRTVCIHFRAELIILVFHSYIVFISWFVLTSFTISPVYRKRCHFREQ